MKLNKIALALFAITAAPLAANAGVTISPLLLGYHYSEGADDEQLETMGTATGDSFYKENGLYTGAALGIELTPSTQFQVEYGVSNTDAVNRAGTVTNDAEQEMISGNFLIGTEEFTGYTDSDLSHMYWLVLVSLKSKLKTQLVTLLPVLKTLSVTQVQVLCIVSIMR